MAFDAFHAVVQVVSVAVFPQQWPPVRGQFSAHDSRCAGICGYNHAHHDHQGNQQSLLHILVILVTIICRKDNSNLYKVASASCFFCLPIHLMAFEPS